jgi:peptidoglycan/LPS O-acetylase OafA/YrhL
MNNQYRFYEIDLLRFIAAMIVVLFHYTFRGFADDNFSPLHFPVLGNIFKYGYLGVELFFIISGFVIFMSVQQASVTRFIIGRISRLYPAFWFSATLTVLFIYFFDDKYLFSISFINYLKNLSMLSGFFYVPFVDGVYWTLLIELKFYFIIFITLLTNTLKHYIFILYIWVSILIAFLFLTLPNSIEFFVFPEYASYFIAGSTFFLIRKSGGNLGQYLLLFICYLLSIHSALNGAEQLSQKYHTMLNPIIVSSIISLYYGLFLLIAFHKSIHFNSKKFIFWGALTYPLYLIHQNIGYIIFNHFALSINKYLLLLGCLFIMLLLAYFIHNYVEKLGGKALKIALSNNKYTIWLDNLALTIPSKEKR